MDSLSQVVPHMQNWFFNTVMVKGAFSQFLVILAAFLISFLTCRFLIYPWVDSKIKEPGEEWKLGQFGLIMIRRLSLPVIMVFLLWIARGVAQHFDWAFGLYYIAKVLLIAWILSRLIISLIMFQVKVTRSRTIAVLFTFVIWLVAMLEISHLLNPAISLLDNISLNFGKFRLSLLHLIEGGLLLLVFLFLGRRTHEAFSNWVKTIPNVSPSSQVLFFKLFKVGFYTLAIIIVLGGLGLDLTNIAWFSGAVGLGLGFGLQKVISNIVSGFIILADKSIKPGDVVQVGGTYGWINHLGSRYVSVVTRDALEYLIPNEDFITGQVINWSYSNELVRLKIPVGIAYGSNLELAMQLMLEAARAVPRVLPEPEPSCRLMGFGDSAINFQLRIWINDPPKGIRKVESEVLLEIWKKFQEYGIEIPFPQRVLYHKFVPELRIENIHGEANPNHI
jgi:small-conductance mechanosensitive channel